MAIRNIREEGDPILRKKCRRVDTIDNRITTLLDDMAETMKHAEGVGLAAPQVGVLRAVIVVDVGQGLVELINPELVEAKGSEVKAEGCLSIPDKIGKVERPTWVRVKALDRRGQGVEIKGEGMLARALCHEIDHLNGVLFIDKLYPESR